MKVEGRWGELRCGDSVDAVWRGALCLEGLPRSLEFKCTERLRAVRVGSTVHQRRDIRVGRVSHAAGLGLETKKMQIKNSEF